ncbi:tagaturonate reductase [Bacillus horti]|uniref:Tagaturonate reductase n=1 Tax=Caldalkalibacillus horti TaxID=77523 RepID=A0ABT9VUT5_9BACI|nr:tagaturonate reductase [Bacillus horti]MDQ0164729.1 tagaturonate reductase [Bacillus horti]
MEQLSKTLLQQQKSEIVEQARQQVERELPERVIQIGEGNFLRGFIDWMIHELNKKGLFNGSIVAVQPTPRGKVVPKLNAQDGLYTLAQRGVEAGIEVDRREVITSISRGINPYSDWQDVLKVAENRDIRFMFSNTTEAGLTYLREDFQENISPLSFPGKVTAFLFHRYTFFEASAEAGMIIIPCELIDNNGDHLQEIVLQISKDWNLPEAFTAWVQEHNLFCNTLVDRIVTGFPKDSIEKFNEELGYEDILLTVSEPYHLFAIEANKDIADLLPFQEAGLNVHWKPVAPFRERKVRILNGAHTLMFAAAFLAGIDTVKEAMDDNYISRFIRKGVYEEILPLLNVPEDEKVGFANATLERFLNPFNQHYLLDISLNSIFKWRTRILPSFMEFVQKNDTLPQALTFSLSALLAFYRPQRTEDGQVFGIRLESHTPYPIRDSAEVTHSIEKLWQGEQQDLKYTVQEFLSNEEFWGVNLAQIPALPETIQKHVEHILSHGIRSAIDTFLND